MRRSGSEPDGRARSVEAPVGAGAGFLAEDAPDFPLDPGDSGATTGLAAWLPPVWSDSIVGAMKPQAGRDLQAELEAVRRENLRLQGLLHRLEAQRLGDADRIQLDVLFASLPYLFFLMGADDKHLAFRAGRLSVP